jgi:hypothetical protein
MAAISADVRPMVAADTECAATAQKTTPIAPEPTPETISATAF